ncbi:MAG: hypothetical protein GY820_12210 [Gammaproteobacteria bacterium]|nr:hypothetical protein [Gammaproteobacteria bacterium]
MTTVFNKIHRLKQQSGWTWDYFLSEIDKIFPAGLNEKTLYAHYRHPHKKANSQVTTIINKLHDKYFADPFPDEVNRLFNIYNNLLRCKSHSSKIRDIEDLEYFLATQLVHEDKSELLRLARLNWLLGNIHFDRLPTYRDNGQTRQLEGSKQMAIEYYHKSVECIEQHNQKRPSAEVGVSHLFKARHNILACYLNAVPQQKRGQDSGILAYLQKSNYIANSKATLMAEPFQWGIARNGLRFCSLLKNANDAKYFFEKMVMLSSHFLDLDYKPLNQAAIAGGADFAWAIQHVLDSEYLNSLKGQPQ